MFKAKTNYLAPLLAILGVAALTGGCDLPPPEAQQVGYRGTAMEQVAFPSEIAQSIRENMAPATTPAPVGSGGPTAGAVYQNVKVLGDLDVASFTHLMAAITEWVSPEQGCNYCHQGGNFAKDDLYTKIVARRMLQMTRHVNKNWTEHVAGNGNGVTCYTCHRGKPVPDGQWFTDPGPKQARGMAASRKGQNLAMESVAYASLPYDPLTTFLTSDTGIRVQAGAALPGPNAIGTKAAEHTYALMMHLSKSLGVNCTYCHNSRAFGSWEQSPPARVTAWHGLAMVRDLNTQYLEPLGIQYPANRIGRSGDAPKANCATCHNGQPKPLNGANMLKDYPALIGDD